MYEAFYGLKEKPFSILPDPDLIYWGRMHSMAFTMLEFGVMNNAGFTVITGEIGSGKTTLVRHLLKMLNPNITTGLISNSPQGREELLQWILMALGQPFEGNYPKLFNQLQDFATDSGGATSVARTAVGSKAASVRSTDILRFPSQAIG